MSVECHFFAAAVGSRDEGLVALTSTVGSAGFSVLAEEVATIDQVSIDSVKQCACQVLIWLMVSDQITINPRDAYPLPPSHLVLRDQLRLIHVQLRLTHETNSD